MRSYTASVRGSGRPAKRGLQPEHEGVPPARAQEGQVLERGPVPGVHVLEFDRDAVQRLPVAAHDGGSARDRPLHGLDRQDAERGVELGDLRVDADEVGLVVGLESVGAQVLDAPHQVVAGGDDQAALGRRDQLGAAEAEDLEIAERAGRPVPVAAAVGVGGVVDHG